MNKFACFAVLALAAYASAASIPGELDSQSILVPTDTEETAELVGDMEIFSDFCRRSRDHVLGSIKDTSNQVGSGIFSTIMNSAEAVGREVLDTQKQATDRFGNQIAHPDAPIADAKTQIEQVLAEGQKKIQQDQVQPRTLIDAIMATVAASKDIVVSRVSQGFEAVKAQLGVSQALAMLERGCNLMAQYDAEVHEMFEESKAAIVAQKPQFANLKLEQVPCVTSRRVVRADGVCNFAKNVQGPVTKLMQTRAH